MTPETPSRTLDGAIDALFLLGIDFRGLPTSAKWAIHDLHRDDSELLERVLIAIANADQNTLTVWEHYFSTLPTSFSNHLINHERMISNADLTARLHAAIDPEIFSRQSSLALFQTNAIASILEMHLGISTGDARYNEVHAGIIYCAITQPTAIIRAKSIEWYRHADRCSLKLIEENMAAVLSILPALCERRDASADTIKTVLTITPSLAEGAL